MAWDPNTDADLAGYKVYYGTTSGNYANVIDVSNVTTCTVRGLGQGTYYFAVTAYNIGRMESSFSNEVSKTIVGAGPLISFIKSSGIISNAAVITWTTDIAADSQVEYGTTASYGSLSALDSTRVTLHSQTLTGLQPATLYNFRVRSRDAAGNLAVSGNSSFTTATGPAAPPLISAVSVSVSDTGAVIGWVTSEAADSQIEFGTTANYGNSSALDAALVRAHSQVLTGLVPNTGYHFRVKSRDGAGYLAVTQDSTFQTISSSALFQTSWLYPSVLLGGTMAPGDGEYTGVAISNLDNTATTLKFTAFSGAGSALGGPDILNPVMRILRPGEQLPVLDTELFGMGMSGLNSTSRIELGSTSARLAGMFMTFDSSLTFLDGADFGFPPQRSAVLSEVNDPGFTKLLLMNPEGAAAQVGIQLVKADGTIRSSAAKTINGNGTFYADLYDQLFPGVARDPSDFIRIISGASLIPYELFGKPGKDIAILPGQDSSGGATILYSPQYVVGGAWRSTLSLINLDSAKSAVTLRFVGDNGLQVGTTKTVEIAPGGKLLISDQAFFTGVDSLGQLTQGYVEVTSSGARLAGSVVFGDAKSGLFISALPLVSTLPSSIVFSHVASSETWFTGVAILNPNGVDANATIDLCTSDGGREASVDLTIPAWQRRSRLLTELFPSLVGQNRNSGYFRISVDRNVASFALFGTNDLSVLSAIPARSAP